MLPLYFLPGNRWAALRELSGADEQSVTGTGAVDAIRLVDRLLVDGTGQGLRPGSAKELTAADRDRVLASIYIHTYGPRIKCSFDCTVCQTPLDIDFLLQDVLESLHTGRDRQTNIKTGNDGFYRFRDSLRFRLPTGEDECRVLGMPPQEAETALLEQCIPGGCSADEQKQLQEAMEDLAPILDIDMDLDCSECGAPQPVNFDIQSYLLTAIKQEQQQLLFEIHRLARAYGWGLHEILQLPRSSRKTFAAMVVREHDFERRSQL